jgi:ribosomal protein S16
MDTKRQIYDIVMTSVKSNPDDWFVNELGSWQSRKFKSLYINTLWRTSIQIYLPGGHIDYEYGRNWPWSDGSKLKDAIDDIVRKKELATEAKMNLEAEKFVLTYSDPIALARTALEKRNRKHWWRIWK